jgi:hypothetical protein
VYCFSLAVCFVTRVSGGIEIVVDCECGAKAFGLEASFGPLAGQVASAKRYLRSQGWLGNIVSIPHILEERDESLCAESHMVSFTLLDAIMVHVYSYRFPML